MPIVDRIKQGLAHAFQPLVLNHIKSGQSNLTSRDLLDVLGVDQLSDSGEHVSGHRAMQHAAVFQCVRVLSESIGMLPLGLRQQSGHSSDLALDHPVHHVIHHAPNTFQTAQEFWEMCIAHLGYAGNFYAYKVKNGKGQLRELIPFHPHQVSPERQPDFSMRYHVVFDNGQSETLPQSDLFHIKLFSLDGIKGVNPIAYARNTIGLGMSLEKHGARLFKNGGRPSGILSTEGNLSQDQAQQYRSNWEAAHGGNRSGGTAVLGNGLKYQTIALSAVDSQWLESRKYQKSDIAAFYRVPPHMINELERATFTNIEHQSTEFVTNTLMPYVTKIEARIKTDLLTKTEQQAGFYAKFNVNALLRGDMQSRADYYAKMVQNGALSPNEIRAFEDQNPRAGGDIYLTPMNMAIDGQPPSEPPQQP